MQKDLARAQDNVVIRADERGFMPRLCDYRSADLADILKDCDVLMAALHYRQNHLVDVAESLGIPIVYISEYTLKTRVQIERANERNPLVVARRIAWNVNQERLHRRAVHLSDGLQSNGVPTYEAYRKLSCDPMLYFDSRQSDAMLIDADRLEKRLEELLTGRPLRLTWSGRLNKMKGADQLLEVAHQIRTLGVNFTLDIFGDGDLKPQMEKALQAYSLEEFVTLRGFVEFERLIQETQERFDLWLCCHVQGDPSSAYLESLGNGLPLIGYDNEALLGVLNQVEAGVCVPMFAVETLARQIKHLDTQRHQIADWSRSALRFARNHTFDKTFARRVDHIRQVLDATKLDSKQTASRGARARPPAPERGP